MATSPDASIRDESKALELAQRALKLSDGKNAKIWRLVAAADAELGRFSDAIKATQDAIAAETAGDSRLVQTLKLNIVAPSQTRACGVIKEQRIQQYYLTE